MNKRNILLSVLVVMFVLLTACMTNTAVDTNADTAVNIAAEIADFDLPADYVSEFSASLEGYTLVSYSPGDGHSHLYLIQSENESDGEKLAGLVEQIAPGSYDPQTRMTVIETRLVMVREQEVTLVISEGISSGGETYRQVAVPFQGKGGPALLIFSEPVTSWNQETVDVFIASIH
jgi:Na+-translocating ferredoxin:NAD+ oxidoreductase RnfG subunit